MIFQSVMLLMMFVLLTGCGPTIVNIKPPTTEIEPASRLGKGRVHLFPCMYGPRIREVIHGVLNLDPHQKYAEYQTTDNVAEVATHVTADGLRQAGFDVNIGAEILAMPDIEVRCEVSELAALIGGTDWERNVQLAEVALVLLRGAGFVGSSSPRAGVAVELTFTRAGQKFTPRIVAIDKSDWAFTRKQGLEFAFQGALEKYQQKAVTETLKAAGIIAP